MIPNFMDILPTPASPNAERSAETGNRQGDRSEWRNAFEKAAAGGDVRRTKKPGKPSPVLENGPEEEKIVPEGKQPAGSEFSPDTQPGKEQVSQETPGQPEIPSDDRPVLPLEPPVAAAPVPETEVEIEVEADVEPDVKVVPTPESSPMPKTAPPVELKVEPGMETKPAAENAPAVDPATDTKMKAEAGSAPGPKPVAEAPTVRAEPTPAKPSIDALPAEPVETASAKPVENPVPAPEIKPVEGKSVEPQPADRAPAPPIPANDGQSTVKAETPANLPAESEPKMQEMPSASEDSPIKTELPTGTSATGQPADLAPPVRDAAAANTVSPEPPVQPIQPEQPVVPVQPERPVVRRPEDDRGNHGRTGRTGPPEHARKPGPKPGNRPDVPPGMLRAMQQKASDALHRVSTVLNTKHPAAPLQKPAVPVTPEPAPAPAPAPTPVEIREPLFPELPQDRPVPIEAIRGVRELPIRKFTAGPKPAQAPLTEFQALHATARTAQAAAGAKQPVVPIHYASLAEAIVARTQSLSRNGTARLRFALEPNDLGLVKVKIDTRGQVVRVEIAASTSQAVDTLNQGINRLSQQLQDAGYKDAQVQLTLDTATDSGAQAKHSQHAQQQAHAGRRGAANHRSRETARAARQYPVIDTSGRLDCVA